MQTRNDCLHLINLPINEVIATEDSVYKNRNKRILEGSKLIFFVSQSINNYVTIISMQLIFTAAAKLLFRLWKRVVLAAPQITDIFHVSALNALLKDVVLICASARALDHGNKDLHISALDSHCSVRTLNIPT